MTYADTLLANGERATLRSRQHWLAIVLDSRWAIAGLVVAVVLFVISRGWTDAGLVRNLYDLVGWVTLVLFVGGIAWVALTIANWVNEEYLVTNRRVMKVSGVINKHSADSSLEKINDAVLDQNLFGRMFNFGDLDIITAAEQTFDRYTMLRGAIEFKKEILNQKHELELEPLRPTVSPPLRATPAAAPMPAPPAAPEPAPMAPSPTTAPRTMTPAELTQTLAGLADLRDRGAITPEEFEAKKADLLGRL